MYIHHIHMSTFYVCIRLQNDSFPRRPPVCPSPNASALILPPLFQATHLCLLPDSFPCFKRWFAFYVFYLNNILLGLKKPSSAYKSITFRWRLLGEGNKNSLWFMGLRHLYSFQESFLRKGSLQGSLSPGKMGLTPLSRVTSTTNTEYPKEMYSEEVECFMFSSLRAPWSAFQVSGLPGQNSSVGWSEWACLLQDAVSLENRNFISM